MSGMIFNLYMYYYHGFTRYYSAEQFEDLNNIRYLRSLGFSLSEIKGHLNESDADGFLSMLKKAKRTYLQRN